MKMTMVRYRVKPGRAEDNEELVRGVYEQLRELQPDGLHYATFRDPDGVSFVHLAVVKPDTDPHPLTSLPAFQRFTAQIADRCDEPPIAVELTEVESFRFVEPGRRP